MQDVVEPVEEAVVDTVKTPTSLKDMLASMEALTMEDVVDKVVSGVISALASILLAVLVFYVGRWLIRKLERIIHKIFEKKNVEASLASFLGSMFNIVAMFLLIITVIGILGINTSSFIALFASAGVAIGMALSGTLQNFAGGVLVLLLKPYKVGDYIEAQGQSGTVKAITLFSTILSTVDNKNIILPNGGMSTGIINNYSKEPLRRVDQVFSVAYGEDYDNVKKVIAELLEADPRVLKDPSYFIGLNSMEASSVNVVVRSWVKSEDYWGVYFDLNEKIYKTFAQKGITIPFPQLDVHMK
ncbi:MAG: mechanosensitive ion channel [Flavobacteriales bacterium]|nr:mechanosensitive ion channel [Flavobacteriales bacterium]